MKILLINGAPRSGKDTFCQFAFQNRGLVYPYSTIDEVKNLAKILGWNGEKDRKGRKFLSDLKDALTSYNNLPFNYIISEMNKRIDSIKNSNTLPEIEKTHILNDMIFLVQAREPEDLQYWKNKTDAKTLLVIKPDNEEGWGNHADDNVYNFEYDYMILNDGTLKDFEKDTIDFIDMIRKEDWYSHLI